MRLDDLVQVFVKAQVDITGQELAEALWLAQFLPFEPTEAAKQAVRGSDEDSPHKELLETKQDLAPSPIEPERHFAYDARQAGQDGIPVRATKIRIPGGPALPQARLLARAFRELRMDLDSHTEFDLDEEATAESLAEQRIFKVQACLPVMTPRLIRRLEVALVVDCSTSMLVWRETAAELAEILNQSGAFRQVTTWWLDTESPQAIGVQPLSNANNQQRAQQEVYPLYAHHDQQRTNPRRAQELFVADGNRLIVVLTDCISDAWHKQHAFNQLAEWSTKASVTIFQVLPERLWPQTAIVEIDALVSATTPVQPNRALKRQELPDAYWWIDSHLQPKAYLPIVSLAPIPLKKWTYMIAGNQQYSVLAKKVFDQPIAEMIYSEEAFVLPTDPFDLIDQFRAHASPKAQKLAGYFASTYLSVSVMRLFQKVLLPESTLLDLAEFVTSGLVYRLEQKGEPIFEFQVGVRDLLRRTVTKPETLKVLEMVGNFIGLNIGQRKAFSATFPHAMGSDVLVLNEETFPIARIMAEAYESLGVMHEPVVQKIRAILSLKRFSFEVVKVDEMGNKKFAERASAYSLKEPLSDSVNLEMIYIPGGSFLMGSPKTEKDYDAERPQHRVTVPSFLMGKYPVTQAQWEVVAFYPRVNIDLHPNPSKFKGADRPVEQVSWYDAVEFCARLSKKTGKEYRLPSEAEWEYACRAGTTTPFYFGETITTELANYYSGPKGVYRKETTEVDQFPPNSFGLYDMHGNVMEWCIDHWHPNYKGAPTDGSVWLSSSPLQFVNKNFRVLRGGSFLSLPLYCRSAFRGRNFGYDMRGGPEDIGFRCVCSLTWTL